MIILLKPNVVQGSPEYEQVLRVIGNYPGVTTRTHAERGQTRSVVEVHVIGNTAPGKEVTVTLWRDGKAEDVKLTLGELKADQKQASADQGDTQKGDTLKDFGLTVTKSEDGKGVVVTEVEPGSAADDRGLQAGDVILAVNSTEIGAASDFEKAIAAAAKSGKKSVLVQISRDSDSRFVALPVAKG